MRHDSLPVSPVLAMPVLALPGPPEGDAVEVGDELDIGVDPSELVLDEPIVGQQPAEKKMQGISILMLRCLLFAA